MTFPDAHADLISFVVVRDGIPISRPFDTEAQAFRYGQDLPRDYEWTVEPYGEPSQP